ncbi:uncharacterized protein LOC116297221 [Actinia tenebrosa]|uniref:Uncharacterized protein LOC116297221 n=1 Tax=Actinia tenebrosa TaxID=6105 RepID=A0A6P8I161_ACTTE|nr:uncharacterized protein LOC116297221 [Actinia tenebrosa]
MNGKLAFVVFLCLVVLVVSKSTSKHAKKEKKKEPLEDSRRVEGEKPQEDEENEISDRVEGGVGTGQTKPLHDDEAEADAAASAEPIPTKPPTGAKPGEIEV